MGGPLVLSGLGLMIASVVGWLATVLGSAWVAQPDAIEDLTSVWPGAGVTPLGATSTVAVPAGQTLVAFLVGTELRGIAGTTTGDCRAGSVSGAVALTEPVLLDFSLAGHLSGGRDAVAIAGWRNSGDTVERVEITCETFDSTVEGFVAVPSRTATFPEDPWFQPWGWVVLAGAGAVLTGAGVARSPSA